MLGAGFGIAFIRTVSLFFTLISCVPALFLFFFRMGCSGKSALLEINGISTSLANWSRSLAFCFAPTSSSADSLSDPPSSSGLVC